MDKVSASSLHLLLKSIQDAILETNYLLIIFKLIYLY